VDFCSQQGIRLQYIQPSKPTQNACIERFNRSYREDVLKAYYFEKLWELEEFSQTWMQEYKNFIRTNHFTI